MSPRPEAGRYAPEWQLAHSLRWQLLKKYGSHRPFADELFRIFDAHASGRLELYSANKELGTVRVETARSPKEWSATYFEDVRATATRFGLHRFGNICDRQHTNFGFRIIHQWVAEGR